MAKTNSYKKVIAGTMTAAMVAGVVSPVAAAGKSFPDVPEKFWAEDSINYLVEKGAVKGNDKGMFEPGKRNHSCRSSYNDGSNLKLTNR